MFSHQIATTAYEADTKRMLAFWWGMRSSLSYICLSRKALIPPKEPTIKYVNIVQGIN